MVRIKIAAFYLDLLTVVILYTLLAVQPPKLIFANIL